VTVPETQSSRNKESSLSGDLVVRPNYPSRFNF